MVARKNYMVKKIHLLTVFVMGSIINHSGFAMHKLDKLYTQSSAKPDTVEDIKNAELYSIPQPNDNDIEDLLEEYKNSLNNEDAVPALYAWNAVTQAAEELRLDVVEYVLNDQEVQNHLKEARWLDAIFAKLIEIYTQRQVDKNLIGYHLLVVALICKLNLLLPWINEHFERENIRLTQEQQRQLLHIIVSNDGIFKVFSQSYLAECGILWLGTSYKDYIVTLRFAAENEKKEVFKYLISGWWWVWFRDVMVKGWYYNDEMPQKYQRIIKLKIPPSDCIIL